ncbi:hypothetical protein DFH06DRAFT_703293 [Mycena polygramma]|nr:hypothetical protein DFH06DRAFT_703293 [Mycena polygramma]
MRFALISNALGVALLFAIFAAARDSDEHNDIHCGQDSHASFVHNSYTFNTPLDTFTNVTKSFFNVGWYAGSVVTNTTGVDNVPGATRSGPFGGATYHETLTMYSMRSDAFIFSLKGKGFTTAPPAPSVRFDSYTETMRSESICGGTATYIDIISHICSNNQVVAYDLFYGLHMATFPGVFAGMGVTVMAGDCPQDGRCKNE